MKRLLIILMVALTSVLAPASTALAQQATPEFKLGFKALADQIPTVVGQPLENEHYGANGDSLQQTSKGLMVWRKADNWTAFTDGNRTWVNGPLGIQERFNNERFAWERLDPGTTLVTTPDTRATPPPVSPPSSGSSDDSSGGYVNVDGVWVPSPGSSPVGASALCRDGTYSYSQHRQGTCSHHGGVAKWLP